MSLFTEIHKHGNVHVTVSPHGRLHVGNKYVTVSFHPYCGPTFYHGNEIFEPANAFEEEALWEAFGKWHARYSTHEQKLRKQGKSNYRTVVHK